LLMSMGPDDDYYFKVIGAMPVRVPMGQWFLLSDDGDTITDAQGDARALTFSGIELPWALLERAIVYPPGYYVGLSSAATSKLPQEYAFQDKTPGFILGTLFRAAQERGVLPGITWDFNGTRDSAGLE